MGTLANQMRLLAEEAMRRQAETTALIIKSISEAAEAGKLSKDFLIDSIPQANHVSRVLDSEGFKVTARPVDDSNKVTLTVAW